MINNDTCLSGNKSNCSRKPWLWQTALNSSNAISLGNIITQILCYWDKQSPPPSYILACIQIEKLKRPCVCILLLRPTISVCFLFLSTLSNAVHTLFFIHLHKAYISFSLPYTIFSYIVSPVPPCVFFFLSLRKDRVPMNRICSVTMEKHFLLVFYVYLASKSRNGL